MNEPSEPNEHANDPNLEFERPDYGHDYYDEQEPGQEAEYAELPPEKPKSNLWINIAIFGGVAIFALVMAWVNFGSVLFPPKTTANTAPQDANALLAPVAAPTTTSNAAQPVVAPPPAAPVTANSPAAPAPAMAAMPNSTNPAIPGTQPNPAAPTDVAALSVTPGTPVTTPPAANPAATNVMPPTATPAPMAATPAPAPMPDATATAMPVTPTAPPGDNGRLADLEKQNQDLTAKTADQDATIADLKAQLSDAQAKLAQAQAQAAANTAAATPKPLKKIAHKQPAVHHVAAAKPPARLSNSDVPASTEPSSGSLNGTLPSPPPYWVLRSAENNSAWVAHPGDNQLYQITVGDQLPGIGKIISIQQQAGGSWVVMGTQGQIKPD